MSLLPMIAIAVVSVINVLCLTTTAVSSSDPVGPPSSSSHAADKQHLLHNYLETQKHDQQLTAGPAGDGSEGKNEVEFDSRVLDGKSPTVAKTKMAIMALLMPNKQAPSGNIRVNGKDGEEYRNGGGVVLHQRHSASEQNQDLTQNNDRHQHGRRRLAAAAGMGHRIRWRSSTASTTTPPSRFTRTVPYFRFGDGSGASSPLTAQEQEEIASGLFLPALAPSSEASLSVNRNNGNARNPHHQRIWNVVPSAHIKDSQPVSDADALNNILETAADDEGDGLREQRGGDDFSASDEDRAVGRGLLLLSDGNGGNRDVVVQQEPASSSAAGPQYAASASASSSSSSSSAESGAGGGMDDGSSMPSSLLGRRSSPLLQVPQSGRHSRSIRACGRNLLLILENTCNAYDHLYAVKRNLDAATIAGTSTNLVAEDGRLADYASTSHSSSLAKAGRARSVKNSWDKRNLRTDDDAGDETSLVDACCYNACSPMILLDYCHHLYK